MLLRIPKFGHPQFQLSSLHSARATKSSLIIVNSRDSAYTNVKLAKLSAQKEDRLKLPNFDDSGVEDNNVYRFGEFLKHPSGIEAMLNTRALETFQFLGSNMYRCTLQKLQLLNFEVAPIIDLKVTPTDEDCMVELFSCRFEGSNIVESHNDHFSASMTNHITWGGDSEPYLSADVTLNLVLEIYTQPFTMLPVSAVERPGNLMMQALLDRLVPLLLRQLVQDYAEWVQKQI